MITITLNQIITILISLVAIVGWGLAFWYHSNIDNSKKDLETSHEKELNEIATLAENKIKDIEKDLLSTVELYEKYITSIDTLIQLSHQKIKEVDAKGSYSSDDEVGFFFQTLKSIQLELDKFQIQKPDLETSDEN